MSQYTPASQSDVYKEMMLTIRYNGGVRYLLLPIYLAVFAALAFQLFKPDNSIPPKILLVGGMLSVLVFGFLEYTLSDNLKRLWSEVGRIVGEQKIFPYGVDPLPHRRRQGFLLLQTWVLYTPYIAGLLFWLYSFSSGAFETQRGLDIAARLDQIRKEMPRISAVRDAQWEESFVSWDGTSRRLKAVLIDTRSKQSVTLDFDASNGRIVKLTTAKGTIPSPPVVIDVWTIQKLLTQSGYAVGNIDGVMGAKTRAALKRFQEANRLLVTGSIDQETIQKLWEFRQK